MESVLPYLLAVIAIPVVLIVQIALRTASGMKWTWHVDTGTLLRSSWLGSAIINDVRWNQCVRIHEYENGYFIRAIWFFGGGKIWLPRSSLQVSSLEESGLLRRRRRVLRSGRHNIVILLGQLADFIQPAPAH